MNHLIPDRVLGPAPSLEIALLDEMLRNLCLYARLGCGCSALIFLYYIEAGKTVLVYSNFTSLHLQLEMVRSRDVRCLSFPLTVATLLTSTSWLLYGLQVSDLYIVVRLARSCRTFDTAPNVLINRNGVSACVSGPELPGNHHQPHQILSVLEVWIFSFRFTFIQAHAHMRWGGGVEKTNRRALKGKSSLFSRAQPHVWNPADEGL